MDLVVDSYMSDSKYNALYHLDDINKDETFWTNKIFAQYYGIKTIKAK